MHTVREHVCLQDVNKNTTQLTVIGLGNLAQAYGLIDISDDIENDDRSDVTLAQSSSSSPRPDIMSC